jgi:hypothetical protein
VSASEPDPGASKGTKTPAVGKLYPMVREDEVEPLNRSSPAYNGAVAPEAIPLRRFDEPAAPDVQPAELETPIEPAAILTADQAQDPIYHARQSLLFEDAHEAPRRARRRRAATEISRHGRQALAHSRAAGARLSPRGVTAGCADARKRVLILACLTVVLGLGATTVYDALSAGGSDATSRRAAKASAPTITRSTAAHRSATTNPALVTHKPSPARPARRPGHRTRPVTVHHRSRSAARKHTSTPRSTTSSVVATDYTYTTPPTVVAAPGTSSATDATSSSTAPASTSSKPKQAPAFGASGALGPGSSPDG